MGSGIQHLVGEKDPEGTFPSHCGCSCEGCAGTGCTHTLAHACCATQGTVLSAVWEHVRVSAAEDTLVTVCHRDSFLEILSILVAHASLGENVESGKKQCSHLISYAFLW